MSEILRRYIRRAVVEGPHHDEIPPERLRVWMSNFPPNAARRMTRLGLMLGETLKGFEIAPDDSVVYASTFGETIATERYLDGFPAASPLFFQTSIHPSAIEQVLVNRACPVRELTPLAGETDLAVQAALAALLTPAERVIFVGGEEIGTWLKDLKAASGVAFAFALELMDTPLDSLGSLEWRPGKSAPAPPGLLDFFSAILARRPWQAQCPAGGEIRLGWI